MYNPKSTKAEEFIDNAEVLSTLEYAKTNKDNIELIDKIIEKAKLGKGLTHREAAVLLECQDEVKNQEIFSLAKKIKQEYYGNRIVLFAPLYLSNYCINGCVYCPYHAKNTHIPRKKMTQEEIKKEVIALQDMGHKRLAIETGEDPVNNPIEYVLESLKTIYSIHHKNGAIRRANVNIAATTVENYQKLKDAGIGTYILFQETYNKKSYEELHPTGPKHNYAYHTEAMDRAMQGGIDDVGLGVLFGLESYKYEFTALLMHAEHLEAVYGVGPHTISVPRIKHADDINPDEFDNGIDDDIFAKIIACIRISVPYTGMIISTRESEECRRKVLELGISQISGGSKTSVGGYSQGVNVATNGCIASQSNAQGGVNVATNGCIISQSNAHGEVNVATNNCITSQSNAQGEVNVATNSCTNSSANAQEENRQENPEDTAQFDVSDRRTLDEVIKWLIELGYVPSFCTACYREGRVGDRFMAICKQQQIHKFCHPNAIMTLMEYLEDYAKEPTKIAGKKLVQQEIENIQDEKIKQLTKDYLEKIEHGERDFRF